MGIKSVLIVAFALAVGSSASAADLVSISDIQGGGLISPFAGRVVRTEGVVTAVFGSVFYIQDRGDGDPATSDGLAVRSTTGRAAIGDVISVEGRVIEDERGRNGLTLTMINPAVIRKIDATDQPLPLQLGGSGGLNWPIEAIAGAGGGIEYFESLEGMLVRVDDAQVVGPTNEQFSELWIVADRGTAATGMNSFGGITATAGDQNPERLQVQLTKAAAESFQASLGDLIPRVVGVIDYSYGNFELLPIEIAPLVKAEPMETPHFEVGDQDLTIGSLNVENLDPKVEDVYLLFDKKDQDDDVGDGRFDAIARQIVNLLGAPDIVALQEVQDNDGGEVSDVVSSDLTLKTLVEALEAVDPTTNYEAFALDPVDDAEGGQLGGNIRVAYLYDPDRVTPDLEGAYRVDGDGFAATRLPLVVNFVFDEETFRVVNVHLSSKGGSDPLYGTVQPPKDALVSARNRQVATLVQELGKTATLKTVILGDFNSYYYEEPMVRLRDAGYINLTQTSPEAERASYVFEGNSQALDHILIGSSLDQRAQLITFHVNSILPGISAISDHDPKLLILRD